MSEKKCSKCGSPGPFYKHKSKPDGLSNYCVPCMKQMHQTWRSQNPDKAKAATSRWKQANAEKVLQGRRDWYHNNPDRVSVSRRKAGLKRYGMVDDGWQRLFEHQRGLCAVCRMPLVPTGRGANSAVVDHDHVTGHVRGLLHNRCNQAIGLMQEDPAHLRFAAEYLEKNHALSNDYLDLDVVDRIAVINGFGG